METAEIDKELEEVETRIDQTRALYEQYFMGMERIEPQKPRLEIERRLKVLRKEQIRNTAQRFKFNVLVQRFNTLQQYWGRVVREIENGTFKRDVIRAAAKFGDNALTGLAKKRAKELAKVVAAAQAKRVIDEEMELGADDLIEDDDELDPPTPPKRDAPRAYALDPSAQGLYPADLPLVGAPQPAPSAPSTGSHQASWAAAQAEAPPASTSGGASPDASKAPARSAGLRWGASDPSSSIRTAPTDVKRRVAELAAELGAPRAHEESAPAFGALDLDFDEGPGSRRADAQPHAPQPARGLPQPAAPVRAPTTSAVGSRVVPPVAQRQPAPAPTASAPTTGTFGVLDIPLDGDMSSPVPSPSSPGSGVRPGATRPEPRQAAPAPRVAPLQTPPPAARVPAQPAPATASSQDLGEQRLRQIYAKYVETKRSVNESTAGVTYDKLAATLRAQAEKLRSQHPSKSIDYDVVIKDGKTHLKPVLR